jgi:hypothetical protein
MFTTIRNSLLGRSKADTFKMKEIDNMSIEQILTSKHLPHCLCLTPYIEELDGTEENIWINPVHQKSFNRGFFNTQEIRQWAKGTGPIVKGETQEEKQECVYYALLERVLSPQIFIDFDYVNLDNITLDQVKTPMMGTHIPVDYVDPKLDETDVIKGVGKKVAKESIDDIIQPLSFASVSKRTDSTVFDKNKLFVKGELSPEFPRLVKSLQEHANILSFTNLTSDINLNNSVFMAMTVLNTLGYGKFDFANTPKKVTNLSWFSNIIKTYVYYHVLKELNIEIPDITQVKKINAQK